MAKASRWTPWRSGHDRLRVSNYDSLIFPVCMSVALAFALLTAAPLVFGGPIFDNDQMVDTLFLLGGSWRAYQGQVPAIDFGYFYVGVLEQVIAFFMRTFGVGIAAIKVALLLIAFLFVAFCALALTGKISHNGLAVAIMTATCLCLTRQPLEYDFAVYKVISTHSFIYNRLGLAALVISGLFVALGSRGKYLDLLGGFCIGTLCAFSALMKPSFVILGCAAVLGLILQLRWWGLAGTLVAAAAMFLIFDPQLARTTSAIHYASVQLSGVRSAQPAYVLLRAFLVPLVQPIATLLALIAFIYVAKARVVPWGQVLAVALFGAVGLGMASTMGGKTGQLVLPILILSTLVAAEWARQYRLKRSNFVQFAALTIAASLALPHLANLAGVVVLGHQARAQTLVETGPLSRYVAMETGTSAQPQVAYRALAEGISQLNSMGSASKWGIVADRGLSFEYALQARPVTAYPLWQRPTAPEYGAGGSLDRVADVVMLGRTDIEGWPMTSTRPILLAMMHSSFKRCRNTEYWEIFIRRNLKGVNCQVD